MKIALSASTDSFEGELEPRFEEAAFFVFVDLDNENDYRILANPDAGTVSSCGILAAQMLINLGTEVLITGQCPPNVCRIFKAADLIIYRARDETILENLQDFKNHKLRLFEESLPR